MSPSIAPPPGAGAFPNAILVHDSPDPEMRAVMDRLGNAVPAGWRFFPFQTEGQLVDAVYNIGHQPPAIVEIVAHGTQDLCGPMVAGRLVSIGTAFAEIRARSPATKVYLSACLTGLRSGDTCIAEALADSVGLNVCGSRGWFCGTKAEGSDRCVAEDLPLYPRQIGSVDAPPEECWVEYSPRKKPPSPPAWLSLLALRDWSLDAELKDQASAFAAMVAKALRGAEVGSRARVGAEATIVVVVDGQKRRLELLAGGRVVRDPLEWRCWALPEGPSLLDELRRIAIGAAGSRDS